MPRPSFDDAYAALQKWIGSTHTPYVPRRRRGRPAKRKRIVVASDFHVPFHSRQALKELIGQESSRADLLVVAGDLMDCFSTSRFSKTRQEATPKTEFLESQAVLTLLAERFRQVVVIGGNHDSRPTKYLAERLPPEMMEYLRLTGPGSLDPLGLMAGGLENVTIAPAPQAGNADFSFLFQVGDCVITHAEAYSKIPNRAVSGPVLNWLKSFAEPQRIVRPFRCVVQAHTHQAGAVHGDYGVLCIENGCMCPVQSYQGSGKIQSTRPPVLGWTVVIQAGEVTDLRESRFIPLSA